jgi:two-component system, LytTR family, response regulator
MPMPATKPVRCLLIDDEPIARRILKAHLAQVEGFEVVGECSSAVEALSLLRSLRVDLLFLDIEMPRLNGLDLLKSLQPKPMAILITAHREWALEGFELDVVDYLLKPVAFSRFRLALEKYRQRIGPLLPAPATDASNSLYIRAERKTIKLELHKICYIESMSDYLKIHTLDGMHLTKQKISKLEKELPDQFLRIHRSYIVNTQHLQAFNSDTITIADKQLPISRSHRHEVLQRIMPA